MVYTKWTNCKFKSRQQRLRKRKNLCNFNVLKKIVIRRFLYFGELFRRNAIAIAVLKQIDRWVLLLVSCRIIKERLLFYAATETRWMTRIRYIQIRKWAWLMWQRRGFIQGNFHKWHYIFDCSFHQSSLKFVRNFKLVVKSTFLSCCYY